MDFMETTENDSTRRGFSPIFSHNYFFSFPRNKASVLITENYPLLADSFLCKFSCILEYEENTSGSSAVKEICQRKHLPYIGLISHYAGGDSLVKGKQTENELIDYCLLIWYDF